MSDLDEVSRKLVAVFAADVEGYSRLMGIDEVGTLKSLTERRVILDRLIADHRGRIANTAGDSLLAEFGSAVDAVQCAVDAQAALAEANSSLPPDRRINFRIGVHIGDVMVRAGDLFGDGVNIAARLETLAKPGGVCISGATYDQVRKVLPINFADLGVQKVKNIQEPVRVFRAEPFRPLTQSIEDPRSVPLDLDKALVPPSEPSIAVLPFTNMSSDPEQEYFADGITEDIITELSRFKGLLVIARSSTFTYKGRPVDLKKVGVELGVRYVLEGSVRRAGQRVRITGQLIDTETGGHLWAEKYDSDLIDIFELQDQITRSVVATLQTELLALEGSLVDRSASPSFEIWSATKKIWKEFYGLNRESLAKGLKLARALAKDYPNSAEGHKLVSLIASHYAFMGFASDPSAMKDQAENSIRIALSLADNDEHTYWGLGIVLGIFRDKFDEAEAALQRAVEINPNFSLGYGTGGTVLAYAGRARESISKTEYAIRLNPKDPSIFFRFTVLSVAYFTLEDYEQSCKWARLAVERKRDYWVPHAILVASLSLLERRQQARDAAQALLELHPIISLASLPIEPVRPVEAKKKFYQSLAREGIPS
jgi:adenylate cyclase